MKSKLSEMEKKKRYLKDEEIVYQEGYTAIEERLHLINIVTRIQKLESGLCAVIKDDDLLMKKTREIYLKNTTLQNDREGHFKLMQDQSRFKNFLETKDRNEVIC